MERRQTVFSILLVACVLFMAACEKAVVPLPFPHPSQISSIEVNRQAGDGYTNVARITDQRYILDILEFFANHNMHWILNGKTAPTGNAQVVFNGLTGNTIITVWIGPDYIVGRSTPPLNDGQDIIQGIDPNEITNLRRLLGL